MWSAGRPSAPIDPPTESGLSCSLVNHAKRVRGGVVILRREKHKSGECRVRSRFLFLPKRITTSVSDDIRWLEFARWEEEWHCGISSGYWLPTKFVDE